MGFLFRRAAIRLAFGGVGALGAGLLDWRRLLAPAPAPVRVSAQRDPR